MSSETSPSDNAAASPMKKKGGVLRVILFAVLLLMLGLWGWDRYARSASRQAFEKVERYVDEVKLGGKEYSPADIHQLIEREPDRPLEDKQTYSLETYSWPAGLLLKSYVVRVAYRQQDDKAWLHEVSLNQELEQNDLPSPPPTTDTPPTDHDATASAATE